MAHGENKTCNIIIIMVVAVVQDRAAAEVSVMSVGGCEWFSEYNPRGSGEWYKVRQEQAPPVHRKCNQQSAVVVVVRLS